MRNTDNYREQVRSVRSGVVSRAMPPVQVRQTSPYYRDQAQRAAPVIREDPPPPKKDDDDDKPKDDDKKDDDSTEKGLFGPDVKKPVKKDAGDAGGADDFEPIGGNLDGSDANADDDTPAPNSGGTPDTPSGA